VTSYIETEVQPLKHFLVKIDGLTDTYLKGELKRLHAPSQLWNETQGLCEEGEILRTPLSHPEKWEGMVGQKVIFSFLETHAAIRKDTLMVKGCLMVNPEYVIQVGDKMVGQWIFCDRIPIKKSRIVSPTMRVESNDSSRGGQVATYDYHLDKGRVSRENDHYPIGTIVYWGKASYVNQDWQTQNGFLVKHRSLKAVGDEILNWKSLNI